MLYQDALTGALHEAPDGQLYESDFAEYPYQMGEVYDGLGNPVGFLPFIPKIASLATSLLPKVGSLVGGLFGGRSPAPPIPALPAAAAALPGAISSMMPRPPWPSGWVRPPLPYTGLGPRRLYMRCAVWPGPRGLVPGYAAQTPAVPAAAAAAAQTAAAMQAMGGRRRRRRRR